MADGNAQECSYDDTVNHVKLTSPNSIAICSAWTTVLFDSLLKIDSEGIR
jgi:hypothetical protein